MLKYDIRTGVKKIKTKTAVAVSGASLASVGLIMALVMPLAAKAAVSTNYTLFGDASLVQPGESSANAVQVTTKSTNAFGGVSFNDPSGLTVSQLQTLSTDYMFTDGTCGAGSPRFSVGVTNGTTTGHIFFYLGPGPNYNTCALNAWTPSGNLADSSNLVDATQIGGAFYEPYSQVQTAYGAFTVTSISLVADGTGQVIDFDNVAINDTTFDFEPATVTVTIDKYVDGAQATAVGTNNSSFPMVSTWSAANIGPGTGNYSLSPSGFNNPDPYFATTSNMTVGATYTTNEVLGTNVSATCSVSGGGYALVGYTTGNTLALAAAGTPTSTIPNFTNLQSNQFVIVWNKSCAKLTSTDQCKDNGWKTFGTTFKNQGDCVSFVATNGKNQPSGPAKH